MLNTNEIMSPEESFLKALCESRNEVARSLASATADFPCWPYIHPILLSAIRELLPFAPQSSIQSVVTLTLDLYHGQYAQRLFILNDERRLAMFLHVLLDNMLHVPEYRDHLATQYDLDPMVLPDKMALRGLTFVAITPQHVQELLANTEDNVFKSEMYFADRCMAAKSAS